MSTERCPYGCEGSKSTSGVHSWNCPASRPESFHRAVDKVIDDAQDTPPAAAQPRICPRCHQPIAFVKGDEVQTHACGEPPVAGLSDVSQRITEYLSAGGLWNPELMNHEKVRDILIDVRAELDRLRTRLSAAEAERGLHATAAYLAVAEKTKLEAQLAEAQGEVERVKVDYTELTLEIHGIGGYAERLAQADAERAAALEAVSQHVPLSDFRQCACEELFDADQWPARMQQWQQHICSLPIPASGALERALDQRALEEAEIWNKAIEIGAMDDVGRAARIAALSAKVGR